MPDEPGGPPDPDPAGSTLPEVRVVSSPRRRRTVSARMVEGTIEVRVPAWMPKAERERWAQRMRDRLTRQARRAPRDDDLERRARELNRRHFDGRLRWTSVGFASQRRRWGSCSPLAGAVRISDRARRLPPWVVDYLLVHELAHLVEPEHGPRFWELVNRYPLTERSRGYLLALDHLEGLPGDAD
ncbi:MAG: M48 family metallopeptidase [Candidatus Dormibacteraeota bacterium]|nr:M48 family metallopeptidase [Candidatus Dormibacteraeota bacterium]MBO0762357.1 M48 family metallopeptidase [Candidatus Dormibacteraeota bacterium]